MPFTRRRGERGASAVEFALVVPLLITLVFGMIDFGYAINRDTVLNNATREGVRTASLGGDKSEVDAAINAALPGDLKGKVTITYTCATPSGGSCGSTFGTGNVAIVKTSYQHEWLTPVGKAISPNLKLEKTSQMRIE